MSRKVLMLLLVIVALSMGVFTFSMVVARGHATDTCVQVQKLEGVIRVVLLQSLHTLGQKGTPGYSYYRTHLPELGAARLTLRQEIAQFSYRQC